MKKLEYPLLALTLINDKCDYIMTPVLQAGLPRAEICSNMPIALLCGRKEQQCLGLKNLHTNMGINPIHMLLDNIWAEIATGNMIRISIESLKLELGISVSIFSCKYD